MFKNGLDQYPNGKIDHFVKNLFRPLRSMLGVNALIATIAVEQWTSVMPQLLKTVLMIPVWLMSLLTPAKSFKSNPVIGSALLNRMGLHVARVLLARVLVWFRWIILSPMMRKDLRQQFHRDGYVVIDGFLDDDQVKSLREEVKAHKGQCRQMLQGDTATQRFLLDEVNLADKPALSALASEDKLQRLLKYGAASLMPPLLYIQRIRNGHRTSGADPQKNMHADTFHPTMKAWLFLEDVSPAKGPFTYVRGSNRLTWARLKWEYQRSLTAKNNPDGYSEKGSFRAAAEDLELMGLPGPEGLAVKAGTLVIANTNGFHGRGHAEAGASRLELWAYSRPTPFNPLPGLPFAWVNRLQMRLLNWHWRRQDAVAARKNSRASWHLIPAEEMTDFDP